MSTCDVAGDAYRIDVLRITIDMQRETVLEAIRSLRSEIDSVEREVRAGHGSGVGSAGARYEREVGRLAGLIEALQIVTGGEG